MRMSSVVPRRCSRRTRLCIRRARMNGSLASWPPSGSPCWRSRRASYARSTWVRPESRLPWLGPMTSRACRQRIPTLHVRRLCLHKARLLAQLGVPFQPSKPRPHTTQCLCHHCILRHSCPSGSQQRPHPRRTAAKPSLCVHMHAAQQMVL